MTCKSRSKHCIPFQTPLPSKLILQSSFILGATNNIFNITCLAYVVTWRPTTTKITHVIISMKILYYAHDTFPTQHFFTYDRLIWLPFICERSRLRTLMRVDNAASGRLSICFWHPRQLHYESRSRIDRSMSASGRTAIDGFYRHLRCIPLRTLLISCIGSWKSNR